MSKVLIIEDEVAIADLEKDYLELSGFEVETENDGVVGLKRALSEDFDMYILDLMLPGIDGFETKLSSSIAVGEETGRLDSLLATISETLDYEAEMTTKRLVTLLEPVMIVIMGIVVGGVVAAVIVPIYQSYGTIGSSSGAI